MQYCYYYYQQTPTTIKVSLSSIERNEIMPYKKVNLYPEGLLQHGQQLYKALITPDTSSHSIANILAQSPFGTQNNKKAVLAYIDTLPPSHQRNAKNMMENGGFKKLYEVESEMDEKKNSTEIAYNINIAGFAGGFGAVGFGIGLFLLITTSPVSILSVIILGGLVLAGIVLGALVGQGIGYLINRYNNVENPDTQLEQAINDPSNINILDPENKSAQHPDLSNIDQEYHSTSMPGSPEPAPSDAIESYSVNDSIPPASLTNEEVIKNDDFQKPEDKEIDNGPRLG